MFHDDDISEKVGSYANIPHQTKADIVQYYQQSYSGKGKGGRGLAWKQALVSDVLREQGHTPENTDPKEYKRLAKNVGKRFESRLSSPEPKNASEYKAIGGKLPPMSYKMPFKVNVSGAVRISRNCVPCSFTVTIGAPGSSVSRQGKKTDGGYSLQGANAEEFVRNPTWDLLMLAYFEGDPDNPAEGWCDIPQITITA